MREWACRDSIQREKSGAGRRPRSLTIAVKKQHGANTITTVAASRSSCRHPRAAAGRHRHDHLFDAPPHPGVGGRSAVHLLLAIGLVVVVVFLFLKNISATIMLGGHPISLVFTFAVMYVLGYSMTSLLLALTMSWASWWTAPSS
jgi:HAE1 family hydrophobic/amphiphilic exporter-1